MVDPQLDGPQLAALAAVVELGSFDAAAERLHVTPSAVSQRIKSLEQQVGQVLYPASDDYRASASNGSDDASAHIQRTVASCPNTRIVLGGYSQGATVIDLSTSAMPPAVADHVAAVALFGEPSSGFSSMLWGGGSLPTIGPLYSSKTINLCAPDDPICTGGGNIMAHVSYVQSGMTSQAATFAANRLDHAG